MKSKYGFYFCLFWLFYEIGYIFGCVSRDAINNSIFLHIFAIGFWVYALTWEIGLGYEE